MIKMSGLAFVDDVQLCQISSGPLRLPSSFDCPSTRITSHRTALTIYSWPTMRFSIFAAGLALASSVSALTPDSTATTNIDGGVRSYSAAQKAIVNAFIKQVNSDKGYYSGTVLCTALDPAVYLKYLAYADYMGAAGFRRILKTTSAHYYKLELINKDGSSSFYKVPSTSGLLASWAKTWGPAANRAGMVTFAKREISGHHNGLEKRWWSSPAQATQVCASIGKVYNQAINDCVAKGTVSTSKCPNPEWECYDAATKKCFSVYRHPSAPACQCVGKTYDSKQNKCVGGSSGGSATPSKTPQQPCYLCCPYPSTYTIVNSLSGSQCLTKNKKPGICSYVVAPQSSYSSSSDSSTCNKVTKSYSSGASCPDIQCPSQNVHVLECRIWAQRTLDMLLPFAVVFTTLSVTPSNSPVPLCLCRCFDNLSTSANSKCQCQCRAPLPIRTNSRDRARQQLRARTIIPHNLKGYHA
ncbi:uncharacterized protein L969DRAFT_96125 [Mixia osmundae IAM 14324]|uniref:Uncharacterized protein n=1 Tax=Mixia osmundae (strain CBS 9802 / IAM 14324 / JCM 22182 / KY 12970) TaxID=764103 RepID=G7EA38_MIXOS|nr:uncharacterized protein L969DRAFT_96125 [Mixia osmundae IAM 14324]KEI37597.1 hypothetical protein L969DRAFT_96125 [Mixia osmundae IAM 14324]GAA99698.1 hypothetical protein E5Q_06401 [Mixia osmundae IAM 14324]